MRKNLILPLVIILSFFITSCSHFFDSPDGSIVFWRDKTDTRITSKTKMKPFAHLKYPIVVASQLCENHNLFGVEQWYSRVWQIGNILVVFDAETETVYDWAFAEGALGWNNFQMIQVGNNWWISGNNGIATKLDATTGEITSYEHEVPSHFICDNSNTNSLILEEYQHDEELKKTYKKVYCFNTDKGLIENTWNIFADGTIDDFKCDAKGAFFTCYKKENKSYFAKFMQDGSFEETEIVEEWENDQKHSYHINYMDDKFLYLHAHDLYGDINSMYPSMLKYDINTHVFSRINIDDVTSAKYNLYEGINIEGKTYYICLQEDGKDLKFGLFNEESQKIDLLPQTLAHNYTGFPYACGTKIFLLEWWNLTDIHYEWYDTKTGEYINPVRITLDEILEN
ncbi:MAG: hypothetical protein K6G09_06660 [Treponema sp.]|nr:hypothetical protein [Treponema sp.]